MVSWMGHKRGIGCIAAAIASSLLFGGCAVEDGNAGTRASVELDRAMQLINLPEDPGEPTRGGHLSYATYSALSNLDPAGGSVAGAAGGSEVAAIYDLLIRYDLDSGEFQPQLAKSLESNDQGRTWTLRLRDGVKFSDGSPVDGEAVVWSIGHYLSGGGQLVGVWKDSVADTAVVDPTTVDFRLKQAWSEFPALLAGGPGAILAPSSVSGSEFKPIGAGPFLLDRWDPGTELKLKANPDYWGGAPYLDSLSFVNINGGEAKMDSLKSGNIDMAYLREPEVIVENKDEYPGYLQISPMGWTGLINNREGHPTSDLRVRQAMAYGIDPKVLDQRADNGFGLPGAQIFPSFSKWHSDTDPLPYDPEKAAELLAEARQDGYDGRIKYVAPRDPQSEARALAVQSMLEGVGFEVTLDFAPDVSSLIQKVYAKRDFDLAQSGIDLYDPAPFIKLYTNLYSTASRNCCGYGNPEMDAILKEVQSAPNDEVKRKALADLQVMVNDTVPLLNGGSGMTLVAWNEDVHGVVPSLDAIILFDKVWIS